jgi:3-oxoacyl-[acyl-carrier protein] reductase
MDLGIAGKVAMVAASSRGIGFAIAEALAAEGCRVSLCARNPAALGDAVSQLRDSRGYVCDVARAEDIEHWHQATRSEIGSPEIVVTNTGGPPAGALSEMSDEQWQAGFDGTILNVVRLVRLVSPAMRDAGWGRIVHVSSLVAKEPARILPISSTLRAGLMALTRLQSTELAPFGITVNAVLPGHTLTDRQVHLAEIRASREGLTAADALKLQAEEIPTKRLAQPPEIAAAAAFLCSAQASYVTGVSLLADGGMVRGPG